MSWPEGELSFLEWPEEFYEDGFEEDEDEEYVEEEEPNLYQFITALDERVCDVCGPLNGQLYSEEELETEFPDLMELTAEVIKANLHANCRCELMLVNSPEETT